MQIVEVSDLFLCTATQVLSLVDMNQSKLQVKRVCGNILQDPSPTAM